MISTYVLESNNTQILGWTSMKLGMIDLHEIICFDLVQFVSM
jgi:hypothetical protein